MTYNATTNPPRDESKNEYGQFNVNEYGQVLNIGDRVALLDDDTKMTGLHRGQLGIITAPEKDAMYDDRLIVVFDFVPDDGQWTGVIAVEFYSTSLLKVTEEPPTETEGE